MLLVISTALVAAQGQDSVTRRATHYGYTYNGSQMGCANAPRYSSEDTTIIALGFNDLRKWPCGTHLAVSGPVGSVLVTVQDSCPGCDARNMIDLSEAGLITVCGSLGGCEVTIYESW